MKTTIVLGLVALTAFAGFAVADGKNYINPNAGVGVSIVGTHTCPPGTPTPEEPLYDIIGAELGGVSFCPNHVSPDADGNAAITIVDDVQNPVSGTYCQDLNGNSICGEDTDVPPNGLRNEPRLRFCGTANLNSPLVLQDAAQWTTGNWEPSREILIFVDGPGLGNPLGPCAALSNGLKGIVNHS